MIYCQMKITNIYFFILVVILTPLWGTSQIAANRVQLDEVQHLVKYNLTYQPDSTNNYHIREEPMILLIGKHYSRFLSYHKHLLFDSLMLHKSEDAVMAMMLDPGQRIRVGIYYEIYKNHIESNVLFRGSVGIDHFQYYEPIDLFAWEIHPDTKTKSGLHLQKATTTFGGRDWEAWFTFEIPINEGPYKFNGLPGLIIDIKDTRNHYVFEMISFEKHFGNGIIELSQDFVFIETTKRNFFKTQNIFYNDISRGFGESLIMDPVDQEEFIKRGRRRNNPLELTID